MGRQPRFFVPGEAQHVIQRGNNRTPIFAHEDDEGRKKLAACMLRAPLSLAKMSYDAALLA